MTSVTDCSAFSPHKVANILRIDVPPTGWKAAGFDEPCARAPIKGEGGVLGVISGGVRDAGAGIPGSDQGHPHRIAGNRCLSEAFNQHTEESKEEEMEKTWQMIKRLAKEEEGLEMVEYAVAAGLIVAALLVTWAALGGAINTRLQELLTAISG